MEKSNSGVVNIKKKVEDVVGLKVMLRVNRGRNKIEMLAGAVESVYPSVFTVRTAEGELATFSYSDVIARNIIFQRG